MLDNNKVINLVPNMKSAPVLIEQKHQQEDKKGIVIA